MEKDETEEAGMAPGLGSMRSMDSICLSISGYLPTNPAKLAMEEYSSNFFILDLDSYEGFLAAQLSSMVNVADISFRKES